MATPYPDASGMDSLTASNVDKLFVGNIGQFQQVQALANKSATQLSNMTDNVFLQMTQLYQAQASQVVQDNKLAESILAERAAQYQPQVNSTPGAA
jgi:hypothetical protein